jgi:hypothetical protein
LTGRESRKQLDRFDRDLLAFMLSWAPYGGPPDRECFVEFGMSADRVQERCRQVVCTAHATDYGDTECSLLLRASRLLLGHPSQNRFARRAVSARNLLGGEAVIAGTAT